MRERAATAKKALATVTKKMRADSLSLKEKRHLFQEKSEMILEEVRAENEKTQAEVDARYSEVQASLKTNFEKTQALEAEKERETCEEKTQLEELGRREEELQCEARRLEAALEKTRAELGRVAESKRDFEGRVEAKQRRFLEREAELTTAAETLLGRKEAEETLKVRADQDKDRISGEAGRLARNLESLETLISAAEARLARNSEFFEKVARVFCGNEESREDCDAEGGNVFSDKRAFERRMEELSFQAQSLEEEIRRKRGEVADATAEAEELQSRIDANDADKRRFIAQKKFSQANASMKQSKQLCRQKAARLASVDALEAEVGGLKTRLAEARGQLEQLKEGASEMWLNVKRCALERVEQARTALGLFAGLFESEVFAHLGGTRKGGFDLEAERAHVRHVLSELDSRREILANEIREEDESGFDGELLARLLQKLERLEEVSREVTKVQTRVGSLTSRNARGRRRKS